MAKLVSPQKLEKLFYLFELAFYHFKNNILVFKENVLYNMMSKKLDPKKADGKKESSPSFAIINLEGDQKSMSVEQFDLAL